MDTTVRIGLLYELYGFVLTETQRELCEAHYYEDLSLSEIAENRGISKQAVSTQLGRAVDKMEKMEEHLSILSMQEEARALYQNKDGKDMDAVWALIARIGKIQGGGFHV